MFKLKDVCGWLRSDDKQKARPVPNYVRKIHWNRYGCQRPTSKSSNHHIRLRDGNNASHANCFSWRPHSWMYVPLRPGKWKAIFWFKIINFSYYDCFQAVYRKACKLGLKVAFATRPEVENIIRLCIALALVPADKIVDAMQVYSNFFLFLMI